MTQMELFAQPETLEPSTPSLDIVRARLDTLLGRLRGAEKMPLSPKELAYWQVVTPQMTNWLPHDEASQLRFEFAQEMARLQQAA